MRDGARGLTHTHAFAVQAAWEKILTSFTHKKTTKHQLDIAALVCFSFFLLSFVFSSFLNCVLVSFSMFFFSYFAFGLKNTKKRIHPVNAREDVCFRHASLYFMCVCACTIRICIAHMCARNSFSQYKLSDYHSQSAQHVYVKIEVSWKRRLRTVYSETTVNRILGR